MAGEPARLVSRTASEQSLQYTCGPMLLTPMAKKFKDSAGSEWILLYFSERYPASTVLFELTANTPDDDGRSLCRRRIPDRHFQKLAPG